jgi:hypothetical protein
MPTLPPRPLRLMLRAAVLAGLLAALPAHAQDRVPAGAADSTRLRKEAEELQAAFESFRERSMPAPIRVWDGSCDLRVGRMCMRHDRGEDAGAPPEPTPVALARGTLLTELGEIRTRIPGDGWILAHQVLYQLESGATADAESAARRCDLAPDDRWWCSALLGLVLHRRGQTVAAAAEFEGALRGMPETEAQRWTLGRYLLDPEGRELLARADAGERARLERRTWLLADPFFAVEGNEREVEQYARFVVRRIRETGANPYGIPWDEDLEELLIRYGQEIGWERVRGTDMPSGLMDGRSVIGRQIPGGVEYLPASGRIADPASIPTGEWIPEGWTPRTAFRVPYAGTVIPLESQVARFRRGTDSLLVAAAWAPAPEEGARRAAVARRPRPRGIILDDRPRETRADPFAAADPFGAGAFGVPEPVEEEAADDDPRASRTAPHSFFVLPLGGDGESDGAPFRVFDGTGTQGTGSAVVPNGRYVVSIEALDPEGSRGWRARQGLAQRTIPPDLPSVSDLVVLSSPGPEAPPVRSFEEALPRLRPGTRVSPGETVAVGWEMYGMRPEEPVSVTLGLDRDTGTGLLQRAGEFLRIVQPEAPVTLTFQEEAPEGGIFGRTFRSVNLTFPDTLAPGRYILSIELRLPGRTPITTERTLIVEPSPEP